MSDKTGKFEDEMRRQVEIDGVKLEVLAFRIGDGEWVLSIINELGVATNWTDFFESAQQALDTGVEAIQSQGVGPFVDVEGFEYLLDK